MSNDWLMVLGGSFTIKILFEIFFLGKVCVTKRSAMGLCYAMPPPKGCAMGRAMGLCYGAVPRSIEWGTCVGGGGGIAYGSRPSPTHSTHTCYDGDLSPHAYSITPRHTQAPMNSVP